MKRVKECMLFIGSDHGGFNLKEFIKGALKEENFTYRDMGTYDENSVDYPDIAQLVAQAVVEDPFNKGILCCGTGIGISIAANKVKGIRAALCFDEYTAEMSRRHNDANVLCLGGRTTDKDKAFRMVDIFLKTPFEGGRHSIRIEKIREVEKKQRSK